MLSGIGSAKIGFYIQGVRYFHDISKAFAIIKRDGMYSISYLTKVFNNGFPNLIIYRFLSFCNRVCNFALSGITNKAPL